MGVYILGHNLPVAHFRSIRMWTERGIIYLEDKSTGQCKSITVSDCVRRIKAINDMIREVLDMGDWKEYYHELHEMQTFVEKAIEVMRKAKEFQAEHPLPAPEQGGLVRAETVPVQIIEGFKARTPSDKENLGRIIQVGEVPLKGKGSRKKPT